MRDIQICYYHRGCSDGLAAAWCVKMKYGNVKLIPIYPAEEKLSKSDYRKKSVIFVDVCCHEKTLKKVCKKATSVLILDHHETYKEILESFKKDNLTTVFDMDRAGCQIAWDYFNKTQKHQKKKRPWFLDYIADRDLWKWELPNSKLVNIGLYHFGHITLNSFDILNNQTPKETKKFIAELLPGAIIIDRQNKKVIGMAARYANNVTMKVGKKTYSVWLSTISRSLKSDLGNELAMKILPNGSDPDFSAIWTYDFKSNEWWISLRGVDEKVNLSKVSKKLGGGGHPNAASFTISGGKTLHDFFIQ
jgi:uncharacterized protein